MTQLFCLMLLIFLPGGVSSMVENGWKKFALSFDGKKSDKTETQTVNFTKSMYKDSDIMFKLNCESNEHSDFVFSLDIVLLSFPCGNVEKDQFTIHKDADYDSLTVTLQCHKSIVIDRHKLNALLGKTYAGTTEKDEEKDKGPPAAIAVSPTAPAQRSKREAEKSISLLETDAKTKAENAKIKADEAEKNAKDAKTKAEDAKKKKADEAKKNADEATKKADKAKKNANTKPQQQKTNPGENKLPPTSSKSIYLFQLKITSAKKINISGYIESKHKGSFLSSMNWPLLPFYGAMSLLYLAFAIGWFVSSCCNWRDLLRLQFWVGGVIALGMFENALFYTEYQSISHHGKENGLLYFAEIVSCIKKALARILVVIVSMGFGIVKPRLGQTLHKVLAVGGLYFLMATIEGCIRIRDEDSKILLNSKTHTYALVPLILLDVGLCWWIFTSLVQTTRTLRIRKNLIKLTLYRHFTNTLVFAVLASLAYMLWMIKEGKFTECVDVTSLWLNDAIWPFLFALILAVIMILWRPSNNNQRYAFTPLDVGDSDEDDDMTLSEAFEGMKMRNKSDSQMNGGTSAKNRTKQEDDLKWVEENIPSVPSTLLPTLDSDEEIIMTKFETSKMD